MTPKQFRDWRRGLRLKQKDAADHLGLKKRVIQYYEKGERNGKAVEIPKYIRLACFALSRRVVDYDGKHIVLLEMPSPEDQTLDLLDSEESEEMVTAEEKD